MNNFQKFLCQSDENTYYFCRSLRNKEKQQVQAIILTQDKSLFIKSQQEL